MPKSLELLLCDVRGAAVEWVVLGAASAMRREKLLLSGW